MTLESTASGSFRDDARVIGLVAAAHALSHLLQLALPPLFVLLRGEFEVSYAALGAVMSVFYGASGLSQVAAGFAVDRYGARPALLSGMALLAGCTLLAGVVPAFGWLYVLAALMGMGNGVFHPADFAVLNARVHPSRLGHAFSSHAIGGNVGYAIAPVVSFGLGAAFGWRAALVVLGASGLVALGVMATRREDLRTQGHRGRHEHSIGNRALFRQLPIVLCFAFFFIYNMGSISVQTFVVPALHAAYDLALSIATTALTGYLLGSALGMLVGGFLASATQHHDRIAGAGLASAAVLIVLCAVAPIPAAATLPLFALAGFAIGSIAPSRDMIVRKATPPGASGRTYGFVYSGLDIGATVGPLLAGVLLDRGAPRMVFVMIGACLLAGMAMVLEARRRAPLPGAPSLAD